MNVKEVVAAEEVVVVVSELAAIVFVIGEAIMIVRTAQQIRNYVRWERRHVEMAMATRNERTRVVLVAGVMRRGTRVETEGAMNSRN